MVTGPGTGHQAGSGGEAREAPDGPGLLQPSFRRASWAALPRSCDIYMTPGEAAVVTNRGREGGGVCPPGTEPAAAPSPMAPCCVN